MTHLGERITSLVDGQLTPEATEKAYVHAARCRPCRDALEAERLMKARLASLPVPEPGAALLNRLLALGGPSGPLPPRVGHVPGTPRPQPVAGLNRGPASRVDALGRPSGRARGSVAPNRRSRRAASSPARRPRRARLAVAVLGALSVVGVGVTGLIVANPGAPAPVVPAMDSFVSEHAVTTSDLPFVDVPAGWQDGGVPLINPSGLTSQSGGTSKGGATSRGGGASQ